MSSRRSAAAQAALFEVESWDDVPDFANEAEEAEFWSTHSLGTGILAQGPTDDPDLPPPRTREAPTAIRFNADTLVRMRALARRRGIGYQTLIKQFVVERLYEEEKRDRVV